MRMTGLCTFIIQMKEVLLPEKKADFLLCRGKSVRVALTGKKYKNPLAIYEKYACILMKAVV